MTGPSACFSVGPQEKLFTIPKRLLNHFSDYAKTCLESSSSEASAIAIRLLDVDPDVLQYLWQWLYSGNLWVTRCDNYSENWGRHEELVQTCQILCRVHVLGERLLFDYRFLRFVVLMQLDNVIEEANTYELKTPLSPEVVEEVLSGSAPVDYASNDNWSMFALRSVVLRHLCSYQFYTTVDFKNYVKCFQIDGAFATELVVFLASEIKWAKQRAEAELGWPVDVFGKEDEVTADQGSDQSTPVMTKLNVGVWVALRRICTSERCDSNDIREFSKYFELDGAFAAAFLNHMATEFSLTVERWGKERGEKVDIAAEKGEEEE